MSEDIRNEKCNPTDSRGNPLPEWPGTSSTQALARLLFSDTDSVVELRAIGVNGVWGKGVVSGYFDNAEDLVREAEQLDGKATGIYTTINPVRPDLLARAANRVEQNPKWTTSDKDILARKHLLIDVDPVRPSGISSTDEEQRAAFAALAEIKEYLDSRGFPEPSKASSGNGGHLKYRIDLSVDDGGQVRRFLEALAFRFNSEKVQVDVRVDNPARICRLYGTMARKGDDTATRPHRRSRLFSVPDAIEVVPVQLLELVAGEGPRDTDKQSGKSSSGSNSYDVEGFIARHHLVVSRAAPWQGGWKWILGVCPFNSEHTDDAAFILRLANGAISAGCLHNGCTGKDWRQLRLLLEPESGRKHEPSGEGESSRQKVQRRINRQRAKRPRFPIELLPPVVQNMVRAVARSRCVDVGSAASLALTAISSAIGLSRIYWDDYADWQEIVVLWLALVAESGSRKTIIIDDFFWPHTERQQRLWTEFSAKRDAYLLELDAWTRRQRSTKPDAKLDAEPRPEEPTLEHVYTTDVTPEALIDVLTLTPRGIIVLLDELVAFFGSLGKYSGKADSDRAIYLSFFRGVQYKKDRKSGGPILIDKGAAWIVGSVQPLILRKCFNQEAFASGLASRFLLVRFRPGVKEYRQGPSAEEKRAYTEFIEALFNLKMESCSLEGGAIGARPRRVSITEDARDLLRDFVPDWSADALLETPDVRAAMSKLEGYALRFALLLRCCREALGQATEEEPITRADLENGVLLARWYRDEAIEMYEELADDGDDPKERALLARVEVIRSRFDGAVTVREWHKRNTRRDREEAEKELEELVVAGLATWRPRGPGPNGGSPTLECAVIGPDQRDSASGDEVAGCGLRGARPSDPPTTDHQNRSDAPENEGSTIDEQGDCTPEPPWTSSFSQMRAGRTADEEGLLSDGNLRIDASDQRPAPRNPQPTTPSHHHKNGDLIESAEILHPGTSGAGLPGVDAAGASLSEPSSVEIAPTRPEQAEDEVIRQVAAAFDGEEVAPSDGELLLSEIIQPGTPPRRACNGCSGRGFHKVEGGPDVCDRCHPGPGPEGWIATWTAPELSVFESMNSRVDRAARLGFRGLGKRIRRPWSDKPPSRKPR